MNLYSWTSRQNLASDNLYLFTGPTRDLTFLATFIQNGVDLITTLRIKKS